MRELFSRGCPLVILACNTASAKALRSIQQDVLPYEFPDKRVLGIVRPTAEEIGKFSQSGHIGIFGTAGTVSSGSYLIEIKHFYPELHVTQHACPMWVPLVEYGERESEGARFFVKKDVDALLQSAIVNDALGKTYEAQSAIYEAYQANPQLFNQRLQTSEQLQKIAAPLFNK